MHFAHMSVMHILKAMGPMNTLVSRYWYHGLKSFIDERPKSPTEKRKIFFSPNSRWERETWNSFPQFREEKEKSKRIFSTFKRKKRFAILKLQEEKEKIIIISPFSRREREILNAVPQSWEEKEKLRVHIFQEEKEKSSQTSCFKRMDLNFN